MTLRAIRRIHHRLLPIFASLKVKPLCRLAHNKLDIKIEKYLNFDGGVYIEAGANDGLRQSNTYYFEAIRKWSGLLIEPVPHLAKQCQKNRPHAIVKNAALVAPDYTQKTIKIENAGLMSIIPNETNQSNYDATAIRKGRELQHINNDQTLEVPTATISELIDAAGISHIDLLSLDVEGYEIEALKGLDLSRHKPRFMCIEVRDEDAIIKLIGKDYEVLSILQESKQHKDILYRLRS